MHIRVPVSVVVFMFSSLLAAESVYQWRDERGQLHFGDRPPPDSGAERAVIRSKPAADAGVTPGLRASELELLERLDADDERRKARRRSFRDQPDREAALKERQDRQCRDFREKVRMYTDRLRAGCPASRCEEYNRQRKHYRRRAREECA